jgi:hypothetical protein
MDKRQQIVSDILRAYRKGEPNVTIESRCSELLLKLSDTLFKEVTDWMLDNPPEFRLDVKYVKSAIKAQTHSLGFPVFELDCPLCNLHFRHSPYAGYDNEGGIHYWCPRCGLSGVDIMDAEDSLKKEGFFPSDWKNTLKRQAEQWKKRTNKFCPDGFAPHNDKRLDGPIIKPYSKQEEMEKYAEFLADLKKKIRHVVRT